jgi:hypothetical protein
VVSSSMGGVVSFNVASRVLQLGCIMSGLVGIHAFEIIFFFTFVPFETSLVKIIENYEALAFYHLFLGKLLDPQWLRSGGARGSFHRRANVSSE